MFRKLCNATVRQVALTIVFSAMAIGLATVAEAGEKKKFNYTKNARQTIVETKMAVGGIPERELVQGISGTAWCTNSFPLVYRTKTMTFNMGDPPSRFMMHLNPGEMYCFIHYSLVPLIVENFDNISTGEVEM